MTPVLLQPTRISAPHGASSTTITWSDGHVSVYPNDLLRGFCPCATCQGHGNAVSFRPGGNSEILELATVGNYALAITWGDRHDSGIYEYRYLRSLCPCASCQAASPTPAGARA